MTRKTCCGQAPGKTPRVGTRGLARRRAILDAARRVFQERGFERATLGDVIALSGGSRTTLHETFGGKEGLLEAVLEDAAARFWEELAGLCLDGMGPEEALAAFARHLVGMLTAPGGAELYRLMVAEGYRHPRLAEAFLRHGPERGAAKLGAWLAEQDAEGVLRVPDPDSAARAFLAMVQGHLFVERLMFPDRPSRPGEVDAFVGAAVRTFMAGVAPRP